MKRLNLMLIACFLSMGVIMAQNSSNKFLIGLGTHAVDYLGASTASQAFDLENWSIQPPISRISFAYSLSPTFALDAAVSLGKVSNTRMDIPSQFFTNSGVGIRLKFANGHILKETSWFDPYLRLGVNYHYYDYSKGSYSQNQPNKGYSEAKNLVNVAGGFGINFWITQKFGLNWETSYNDAFKPHGYQNFLQHSAGVIFRFGGKDTDKDGVPDDKDLCPTVSGPKKLNGCPDTDGDGVLDKDDLCPTVAGEFDGCPDTDGDGLHDGIDKCPTVAGPKENNGCPWPDQDKDGVPDKDDKCPTVAGSFDGCPDTDADGFPDNIDQCPTVAGKVNGCPDADGDGIADKDDACPHAAGPASNDGCPQLADKDKSSLIEKSKSIYFVTGSAKLTNNSKTILNSVSDIMKKYPDAKFDIQGHTDNTGSAATNLRISNARAKSVRDYLEAKGVKNTLTSEGYGQTKPIADNKTAAGRTQNRRVVINLVR